MWAIYVGIGIFVVVVALALFVFLRGRTPKKPAEVDDISAVVEYVKLQKEHAEQEAKIKLLKREEQKAKLETFKQTKEQLRDKLKSQLDAKEWKPLAAILNSADKGGVGIYIIHNKTRDKYYVGQAKQIHARIKKHFDVPDLARDFLTGDQMQVKFLTANELDESYRLDHIEKTGIEIFNAEYNRTSGNI